jgi:hypothetical protein
MTKTQENHSILNRVKLAIELSWPNPDFRHHSFRSGSKKNSKKRHFLHMKKIDQKILKKNRSKKVEDFFRQYANLVALCQKS